MRGAKPIEIERWDELIAANPDGGNVLQGLAFAETKADFRWRPKFIIHGNDIAALYLIRKIPVLGELWYCPKGPGVSEPSQLAEIASELEESGAFLVKIEPELTRGSEMPAGFTKALRDIQYNTSTVVVDLGPGEEEIIANFKQKTRYNIRLAERKGVTVKAVDLSPETVNQMYGLMQETQKRAGFYLRSKSYFETFWRRHIEQGSGQLFFARFEGKILAGVFATYLGTKSLYKDGGSTREHSEVQAPYLLQWEVMRWLKAKGVTEYDLHGTPPSDQLEDESHPLFSLVRFKTGFNQQVTDFPGTLDLPLEAGKYRIWNKFGERLMSAYCSRIKHELFY